MSRGVYVEAWALHYIQIMKMCILHPSSTGTCQAPSVQVPGTRLHTDANARQNAAAAAELSLDVPAAPADV